jgi:hypothetical protein
MFEFFSTRGYRRYVRKAQRILAANWTGRYTKPSPQLYPHQWNWDSCFIAIGYAHYDEGRAMRELASLLEHQWPNGMIPQIVFDPAALGGYFPEPDFWAVPEGRPTSGITMPPLHATACLHVYRLAKDKRRARGFLEQVFPRLMASHRYFHTYRDPDATGLVYIRHPWESGLDNSPSWDKPLCHIDIDKDRLPPYERKDLSHDVPTAQRPSDEDYDRYVYLVDLFRRCHYDEKTIFAQCPFLIQDVLFNAILCRSDRDLVEIGKIIAQDTGEAQEWAETTATAISRQMWSPEHGRFESFDLVTGQRISSATAAGFMPLFALAASSEQAERLYQQLNSLSFCALHQGNCYTIPNYDMSQADFDPQNYWRGPVWMNINWMLSQGLKRYGYQEKADAMKKDLIQLPVRFGFHEYFDSITGQGYGSDGFSWTSALFIDLVYEYYDRDEHALIWSRWGKGRRLKGQRIINQVPGIEPMPQQELASKLMAAIGDLKETFYDMNRGRVDYQAMKASGAYRAYRELAAQLQGFDPNDLITHEERLAFWVNLYNAIVVHGIADLGITSSVREVPNFFSHICYQIGPHTFSPDEIEHGVLRSNARPPHRIFTAFKRNDPRSRFALEQGDPRIHFALVCGSRSCAPIRFYEAGSIDEQLEKATMSFVNSSEVVLVPEENKILLSQVFNWYQRDFGSKKDIFKFLLRYLVRDTKSDYLAANMDSIEVEHLFYDWNLNH